MSSNDAGETRPRVLFVYYTYTQQAQRACEVMADVMRTRGCDVSQAAIEFTDPRYSKIFKTFPFKHGVFSILPLLGPQLRRKTGQIQIPDEAKRGDYDLVCFGSATWFFRTNMPLRSYLKSDEARTGAGREALLRLRRLPSILEHQPEGGTPARHRAGRDVPRRDPFHVRGPPNPVAAGVARLLRQGRDARALLGHQDPADQPKPDFRDQAQAFANQLADTLAPAGQLGDGPPAPEGSG